MINGEYGTKIDYRFKCVSMFRHYHNLVPCKRTMRLISVRRTHDESKQTLGILQSVSLQTLGILRDKL